MMGHLHFQFTEKQLEVKIFILLQDAISHFLIESILNFYMFWLHPLNPFSIQIKLATSLLLL